MRATFLLVASIGVLAGSPAYAFTTLAVKSASCVVSTGMHMAIAFIVPFLLIFGLYRTLQIERDLERAQIENYFLLFLKVLFLAMTIRLGVEIVHFFGVPVKWIAQDMLYCRNGCDLLDAPEVPVCKDLPFERVLKLLLTASAFFAKTLAILVPAVAYVSLFYRSASYHVIQAQRGYVGPETAGLNVLKDGIFYFAFVLPYVFLASFSLDVDYVKIVEWFARVMAQ